MGNPVKQSDSPAGTRPLDGAVLSIGKPSTVFVWNARMIMDNLAIWEEEALTDEEIAVLYETGGIYFMYKWELHACMHTHINTHTDVGSINNLVCGKHH